MSPHTIINTLGSSVYDISFNKEVSQVMIKDLSPDVYDIKTGYKLFSIRGNNDVIQGSEFLPNGEGIAVCENFRISVIPWPSLQQLINETLERFKDRQLTSEERRKYNLE